MLEILEGKLAELNTWPSNIMGDEEASPAVAASGIGVAQSTERFADCAEGKRGDEIGVE